MDAGEIRSVFEETGIVRLDGAFPRARADAMARAVWGHLERRDGVVEHDPSTWPTGWHGGMKKIKRRPVFDIVGYEPVERALDAIFGDVGPCGGGTMLLPGTHRVVERYREMIPEGTGGGMVNWKRFMRHDPWLASLLNGATADEGGRSFVGHRHEVDGVPVEVVELTGEPGDVVITHLHVFHSASPNRGARPRQMIGKGVLRAGLRHAAGEGE